MKKINELLELLRRISDVAITIAVMVILGVSLYTRTPILELTSLDSQWWILFLCLMTYIKVKDTNDR